MGEFVPVPGLDEQLKTDPDVEAGVQDAADEGLARAQDLVPVDTGELRDSLHIEDGEGGGKRIVAETDHWQFPEFGTSDMPAEPYLRPVIDDIGLHR